MSKAEDLAFERYPDYRAMDGGYITQRNKRMVYVEGYHQAEKDNELTWEDIQKIDVLIYAVLDEEKYKRYYTQDRDGNFYQEVLKRFKDLKK